MAAGYPWDSTISLKKSNRKRCNGKGFTTNGAQAKIIDASTSYKSCIKSIRRSLRLTTHSSVDLIK
jgi:hypothetical protein